MHLLFDRIKYFDQPNAWTQETVKVGQVMQLVGVRHDLNGQH